MTRETVDEAQGSPLYSRRARLADQGTQRSKRLLCTEKKLNRSQEQSLEGNESMDTASAQTQILKNKHAVIFGAGGAVGTAVAKEFAAQGATVFLSGLAQNDVEHVVDEIHKDGGVAYAAGVDALDEQAVNEYLDSVAKEGGALIFS